MRIITLLITLLIANTCYAQKTIAYPTLNDFINNNVRQLGTVLTHKRVFDDGMFAGATLYDFLTTDKQTNEELATACFALQKDDSLFINLLGAIDVYGYAYVKERFGTYLYFTSIGSNLLEHRGYIMEKSKDRTTKADVNYYSRNPIAVPGKQLYAVNRNDMRGAGKMASSKQFSYLYGTQEGQVFLLTPEMLEDMLSSRPELLRLYISSGSQDNDGVYLWYLKRLFNVE